MKKSICAICGLLIIGAAPAAMEAQYIYTTNGDNTLTITGYTGPGGAMIIPTNFNGLTVTGIGEEALGHYLTVSTNITAVTIPNSVTSIGDLAFWACGLRRCK